MIVGDPGSLAIESGITQAYSRLSLRALGYFVLHVGGFRYGVYKPDATALANSFDEVERRISLRGSHTASFAAEPDAGEIANAYRNAAYADEQRESYFGIPCPQFLDWIYTNHLVWAPDGDEAFDDGSYVLQFDIADRVRLIAFRSGRDYGYEPATLRDITMSADLFYEILKTWRDEFRREWTSLTGEAPRSHPD
jgi:hypothetical protein